MGLQSHRGYPTPVGSFWHIYTDFPELYDRFALSTLEAAKKVHELIETLADLEKVDSRGRSGEVLVAELADKTPDFHPYPNVFHQSLVTEDLLGHPVAMTGQIILSGGVPKPDREGGMSVHFTEPPEVDTMRRWKRREFKDVERLHARGWRAALSGIDFTSKIEMAQRLVPNGKRIANLDDAKAFADSFVQLTGREVVMLAVEMLGVPDEHRAAIDQRYAAAHEARLSDFAPYAAFVLTIDLVFYLGMGIGQIGRDRPSNMIDVSYLYYLPFCMVFTSGDNLHVRLAPMFMRPDQVFVKAAELKDGLGRLNDYYAKQRDEIERVGLVSFVPEPPAEVPTVITTLWDQCLPRRQAKTDRPARAAGAPSDQELLARVKLIVESDQRLPDEALASQPDSVVLESQVPLRRGSWRLMPKGIEDKEKAKDSHPLV